MPQTKIRDDQATQSINLATEVTGQLPLANGGTGGTDAATAKANLGIYESASVASVKWLDVTSKTYTIVGGSVTTINGTTYGGGSPAIGERLLILSAGATTGASSGFTSVAANGIYRVTGNTTNLTVTREPDFSGSVSPWGKNVQVTHGDWAMAIVYFVGTGAFTWGTTAIGGQDYFIPASNVMYRSANETLTGIKTFSVDPRLNGLDDINGAPWLVASPVASAVNYITLANAAGTGWPNFGATGTATDVGIYMTMKGAGYLALYVATAQTAKLQADGVDTDVNLMLAGKNAGKVVNASGVPFAVTGETVTTFTTARNLAATDVDATIEANSATDINLTVPPVGTLTLTQWPLNRSAVIRQIAAGKAVLVQGSGVTINYESGLGLKTRGQWTEGVLTRRGNDVWFFRGGIAA